MELVDETIEKSEVEYQNTACYPVLVYSSSVAFKTLSKRVSKGTAAKCSFSD